MLAKHLSVVAALVLGACAWTPRSNWYLMDEGYSIDTLQPSGFAMEVHVNQLKQLGGEVTSPRFRQFVSERLRWHEVCPSGWAFLPCVEDGSCVERTSRSVTVTGLCTAL